MYTGRDALFSVEQAITQVRSTESRLDGAWQSAMAAAEAVEKVAANAYQKASFSESDLAAKRKPYEDDPLFMYLWKRRHDQAEDTSSNFVRFFDRKVAHLVDYHDARANYA